MYLTRRAYCSHQTSMNMKLEVKRHGRILARNRKVVFSFVLARVFDSLKKNTKRCIKTKIPKMNKLFGVLLWAVGSPLKLDIGPGQL